MSFKEITISPQFVTHEALNIRYAETRKSGAQTVLLLSPWPESLYAFAPIWPILAESYSVVAVDLPGFGQSEGKPDLMSPRAMGNFVVGLVTKLGLERPHAVGPDVGTAALLFAAADHPDFFESIVVGAGSSTYPLIVDGVLKEFIEAPIEVFRQIDSEKVINDVADGIANYEVPLSVRRDYIESYSRGRLFASIEYVRQYPKDLAELASLLPGIRTPVQIVVGRNDAYGLAADGAQLNEELFRSKLNLLNCGHCAWEEDAVNYAAIIADWIESSHKD
jgi:pimeloyl-ACP methyl ester carboxylesterase